MQVVAIVVVDDPFIGLKPLKYKVGTNKPDTACDEDAHKTTPSENATWSRQLAELVLIFPKTVTALFAFVFEPKLSLLKQAVSAPIATLLRLFSNPHPTEPPRFKRIDRDLWLPNSGVGRQWQRPLEPTDTLHKLRD